MNIGIILVLLMIIAGGVLIGGYLVATTGMSFGPIIALVGLSAVAFLLVRKS